MAGVLSKLIQAGYFDNFSKDILDTTSDAKKYFEEDPDQVLELTLDKLEFLIRTYACLMRSIGMDVFRQQNEIFSESYLVKNISIMVKGKILFISIYVNFFIIT